MKPKVMTTRFKFRCAALLSGSLLCVSSAALASSLSFDYVAFIDSSDQSGAPTGSLLTGAFSYDPNRLTRAIGGNLLSRVRLDGDECLR